MMKYDFKGITCEQLSFKLNRVKLEPNQRLDIKPQFSRQVRKANENNKLMFINLKVAVLSTEAEPKPFDIEVSIVGIYELAETPNAQQERDFVIEATGMLYPYLRAMVTNLTAQAYIQPLNLPVINGPIFPEDRDTYAFSVSDN
ncbi:MAG TPA: protein-export chaperone SecB [Candidatus Coproplasma avicola]|uniref:Protein-export chaperone SecB n=1 Tax=Candidatus Coproplasma avicola TaxID=2840744 RepID=A0A9D1E5W4_9FIRM|nr:protein-export chaperone SecB [Candidatus Coproplasma avicola]